MLGTELSIIRDWEILTCRGGIFIKGRRDDLPSRTFNDPELFQCKSIQHVTLVGGDRHKEMQWVMTTTDGEECWLGE